MRNWILISAFLGGLMFAGCGGAEVTADDNPGDPNERGSDFKAGAESDFTEGEFGADVDIDENDEHLEEQEPR